MINLEAIFDDFHDFSVLSPEEEVELAQTMAEGREAADRIRDGRSKNPADDMDRVERGMAARDRFVCANLKLVAKHANRFSRARGMEIGDHFQHGVEGLMRAVDKWDWRMGYKFSTYSTWWIRAYISRNYAESSKVIRTPLAAHVNIDKTKSARERLRNEFDHEPSTDEIAEESGLSAREVQRALSVPTAVPAEIHIESGDRPLSRLDGFAANNHVADPADLAVTEALREEVMMALSSLSQRQAVAVAMRHGLYGGRIHTYAEIAQKLGTSRETAQRQYTLGVEALRANRELGLLTEEIPG